MNAHPPAFLFGLTPDENEGWVGQKTYPTPTLKRPGWPRFRILKGLPPPLSPRERQLVMAALLHDFVDSTQHSSKLGLPLTIPDPYVQWLCAQHHNVSAHPKNRDLPLLQAADMRTSRYARLLSIPTPRRKLAPVDTPHLTHQLEAAAHRSVYQLYTEIYHSQELNRLTASKAHPVETIRNHLIGVANWVLFLLRTRNEPTCPASAALAGQPGGTPGPVEMEDPRDNNEPLASW